MSEFELFGLRYRTPPPTVEILFSGEPVGELTKEGRLFTFTYLPAFAASKLAPIPGFPDIGKQYKSIRLWPFFAQRIPDKKRPEIERFMKDHDLVDASELKLLTALGVRSVTDPFELRQKAA